MKRGKFIIIDGCEGSGKTTLINSLPEILKKNSFVLTKEPGGTPFAQKIRELILSDDAKSADPRTMFGLFWAARAENLKNFVLPNLKKGKNVFCDRFDSSTYAYQIKAGDSAMEKLFWETRKYYLRDAEPDLYIFLDVDPRIGLERVENRKEKKTHFDARSLSYHKEVRQGFLRFLKHAPHRIIDANKNINEVLADFSSAIKGVI